MKVDDTEKRKEKHTHTLTHKRNHYSCTYRDLCEQTEHKPEKKINNTQNVKMFVYMSISGIEGKDCI